MKKQGASTELAFKPRLRLLVLVLLIQMVDGSNYENSAEVEQVAEQENECEQAGCFNEIGEQIQTVEITMNNEVTGYSHGSEYSAEIEQVAEQKNKDCNISECVNTADQEQSAFIGIVGDGGFSSYSAEIEQTVEQENNNCEDSFCGNEASQYQEVVIVGEAGSESYSAEFEQSLEQENSYVMMAHLVPTAPRNHKRQKL